MKKKIVVIDSNENILNLIQTYFENKSDYSVVKYISDGEEALNYLVENKESYDLIVMDLVLPNLDAINIMKVLESKSIFKRVIITANYINEAVAKELNMYNVAYFMLKPYSLENLCSKISLLNNMSDEVLIRDNNLKLKVSEMLHNLGVPSHLKGYSYIRESICYICGLDESSYYITKDIYPRIAKKYKTTTTRVERAIRHAIEVSWSRGELILMENLFGYSVDYERSKPTNSEYINTVADRIKLKMF